LSTLTYCFSFFKRDSTTRRIITSVEFFEFYTLKSRFDELLKHKEEICVKANITNEDFLKTIQRALKLYITDVAIQNRFD
jgi:predicted nucleic acid-binding protein